MNQTALLIVKWRKLYAQYPFNLSRKSIISQIAFWLKRSSDEMNPNIIDSKYPIEMKKIKKQRKEYGDADLFIPYFNERGYRELVAWLYTEQ